MGEKARKFVGTVELNQYLNQSLGEKQGIFSPTFKAELLASINSEGDENDLRRFDGLWMRHELASQDPELNDKILGVRFQLRYFLETGNGFFEEGEEVDEKIRGIWNLIGEGHVPQLFVQRFKVNSILAYASHYQGEGWEYYLEMVAKDKRLPEIEIRRLANLNNSKINKALRGNPRLPEDLVVANLEEFSFEERQRLAKRQNISEELALALAMDSSVRVKRTLAKNNNISSKVIERLYEFASSKMDERLFISLAKHPSLPERIGMEFMYESRSVVKQALAENKNLSKKLKDFLFIYVDRSRDQAVLEKLVERGDLDEEYLNSLIEVGGYKFLEKLAQNKELSSDVLQKIFELAKLTEYEEVILELARNENIARDLAFELAHYPSLDVRRALLENLSVSSKVIDLVYLYEFAAENLDSKLFLSLVEHANTSEIVLAEIYSHIKRDLSQKLNIKKLRKVLNGIINHANLPDEVVKDLLSNNLMRWDRRAVQRICVKENVESETLLEIWNRCEKLMRRDEYLIFANNEKTPGAIIEDLMKLNDPEIDTVLSANRPERSGENMFETEI